MNIPSIQKKIFKLAQRKGWDMYKSDTELISLCICELADAVGCVKKGAPPIYQVQRGTEWVTDKGSGWSATGKPEGTLIELADCVIGIMELCESKGWDLDRAIKLKHMYNETRPTERPRIM